MQHTKTYLALKTKKDRELSSMKVLPSIYKNGITPVSKHDYSVVIERKIANITNNIKNAKIYIEEQEKELERLKRKI